MGTGLLFGLRGISMFVSLTAGLLALIFALFLPKQRRREALEHLRYCSKILNEIAWLQQPTLTLIWEHA
jgi:hypothetical protein